MSRRLTFALCTALAAGGASAQQLRTYTQSETGPQFLTYGLPVPRPIESLTPVDGFRSYASVEARLQSLALQSADLSAHDVGRTMADRTVWAYVASDEDGADVEGRPEAAFFINASTHAREWATPEVSTGTVERLMAGAGDGGIVRFLLDNTRLVIVPVHNIDGVLQTQRYPTDVLVGQDPDFPNDWPRDGRMRRKNMRGVDEVLTTTGDHLLGVDLNRNHPPFWATTPSRSSSNPASLVHHGSGPHSEPESQALLAAAQLAPPSRIRLGIDVHTFGKVMFTSNTARTRLNAIQHNLALRLINHHEAVAGARYTEVPDPANRGIGAAAEYFSYEWLVPGWTLELEPSNDAGEYGGTNVTHGGFILPASAARRVREGWAETHLLAFYQMSGPPHLVRVRYVDVETGAVAMQTRWRYDAQSGRRERLAEVPGTLAPGRRYRAELAFSKPMRWRNAQGEVAPVPGQVLGVTPPAVTLVQGSARTTLATAGGSWLADAARVLRYKDDTFAFEFTAPAALADYTLEVATTDFANMSLDADPATPADWSQGAWSEYENALGIDGDVGGADRSFAFAVAPAVAAQVSVLSTDPLAGEGDAVTLRVTRAAAASRLELRRTDVQPALALASWAAGEGGERSIVLAVPDNLAQDGDRTLSIPLTEFVDDVAGANLAANVRVLDNDDAQRAVWRVHDAAGWSQGWAALAPQAGAAELVADRRDYALPAPTGAARAGGLAAVRAALVVRGNRARVLAGAGQGALLEVDAAGRLELDSLDIEDADAGDSSAPLLEAAGPARLARSSLISTRDRLGPLVRSRAGLEIVRSGLHAVTLGDTAVVDVAAGPATVSASSLGNGRAMGSAGPGTVVRASGAVSLDSASAMSYPLAVPLGTGSVRARASLLDEAFAPLAGAVPNFLRPNCAAPLLASDGGNVFTAHYESGDASQLLTSGCVVPGPGDVFDPTVAFQPPREEIPPLLRPAPGTAAIDAVAACGPVDQRGAPRPQSATGGVVPPRCDAGAYEAGINPYRGIWAPARSGHGVDIQTAGNRLFLAWYTYEDDGEPTAYQASAPLTGAHWEAVLQQASRNPQSGAVSVRDVGRVTLDFSDDTHATLGWRFDARGTNGSEQIAASLFAPGEPRFETTGLWYPPADSGYGATISRRGQLTAIGVYYYDAQGNVRWALGTGSDADAQSFAMTSFRGFCPDCNAAQMPVTGTPAGTLLAHFHTPLQARLDMQLTYPGAAGGQWNRTGARFVPLNDAVDNTDALRAEP